MQPNRLQEPEDRSRKTLAALKALVSDHAGPTVPLSALGLICSHVDRAKRYLGEGKIDPAERELGIVTNAITQYSLDAFNKSDAR